MKYHGLFWALCMSWLVGCGGGNARPAQSPADVDETAVEADAPTDGAEASSEVADEATSSQSDEPKSEMGDDLPPPIPEDWQPNHGDCEDLADTYGELLRAKEVAKLEKTHLSDKQKKQAMPGVARAVEQGRANWLKACEQIVGTTQVRKRWTCAAKAKDLDRFNGCMDGKFDSELPDE